MSSVEMIDLETQNTCSQINDYPIEDAGMTLGIIDGLLKSCGSLSEGDYCYDYNPETNSWITSESMLVSRDTPRSSFIDGVWFVTGDGTNDDDFPLSTDIWTGTEFESGPTLPTEMFLHCQLTVNSTHVFFADTYFTGISYLFDWYGQSWTVLPSMTVERDNPSCGLINNPDNGIEVVIVEEGISEIFNLNELSWRLGPAPPSFHAAGSTQLGDTFIVAGGNDHGDNPLDTIYQFDHLNYEWILKSQKLDVARGFILVL